MQSKSLKCCGRRPSGPAPEPCGKEEIAACMWAVLKQLVGCPHVGVGVA